MNMPCHISDEFVPDLIDQDAQYYEDVTDQYTEVKSDVFQITLGEGDGHLITVRNDEDIES